MNHCWKMLLAWSCVIALAVARARGVQFSPPEGNGDLQPLMDAAKTGITQGKMPDAAMRVDALLQDHGDELVSPSAGYATSVSVALGKMCEGNHEFAGEYAKQFDPVAQQKLQAARQVVGCSAESLYEIGRRYPFTPTAASAYAAAADRAAALGDWNTAEEFCALAVAGGGGALDDAQRRRLDAMKAGETIPPAKNPLSHSVLGYVGAIPFDAPWYLSPGASAAMRYVPWQAEASVFLVTAKRALAFKETGELLWTFPFVEIPADPVVPGKPKIAGGIIKPLLPSWSTDTATLNVAKVLATENVPRVVIVRGPISNGGIGLIALRAEDGQPLWTTAEQDSLAGLFFVPDPTICGRYVYAIASDPGKPQPLVDVLAIDIVTGREIWRTALGSTSVPLAMNPKRSSPLAFAESIDNDPAGITVDGDQLIITPNVGYVFCLDRFDGKLRWMTKYAPAMVPGMSHEAMTGPRYDNHPAQTAGVVIAAAQDQGAPIGLDRTTGQQIWQAPLYTKHTLIGTTPTTAIFAGPEIISVDIKTLQPKWTYTGKITGPAVLCGEYIYVLTTSGQVAISTDTGIAAPAAPRLTQMRGLLSNEYVRASLTTDGAISSFGMPEGVKPPAHH